MLRFFSRRHKPRRDQKQGAWDHRNQQGGAGYGATYGGGDTKLGAKEQKKRDKNIVPCRVILLDGSDLAVEIQVRHFTFQWYAT